MSAHIPSIEEIERAGSVVRPVARETPLLASRSLSSVTGAQVLIKIEALQHTGSFKFRGAYYRLTRLQGAERKRGVVAYSSGNFAQGLAAAGALLDIPVTIVMPDDAPTAKMKATREFGATVELSHHGERPREEAASEMAQAVSAERGATLLHPFDDPDIVAGQGSVALEILDETRRLGRRPDYLFVPVGGGGLLGGCALVMREKSPAARVYAVEPFEYDGMTQSLRTGARVRIRTSKKTICDALQATAPGLVTLAAAQKAVEGGIAVGDADIRRAMALAFTELKIVLEPSGAIAIAALMGGGLDLKGCCVALIASGGNISLADFKRLTDD